MRPDEFRTCCCLTYPRFCPVVFRGLSRRSRERPGFARNGGGHRGAPDFRHWPFRRNRTPGRGPSTPLRASQDCCNDCDITTTAQRKPVACCSLAAFLVSILLFALSWDTLEPTEFGLVANSITGRVDLDPKNVYEGGRHFIWLAHHFLVFPKNRVTIEFSDAKETSGFFQRPSLSLRTGSNHDDDGSAGDEESGGQPLDLSVSFQYNLIKARPSPWPRPWAPGSSTRT